MLRAKSAIAVKIWAYESVGPVSRERLDKPRTVVCVHACDFFNDIGLRLPSPWGKDVYFVNSGAAINFSILRWRDER